MKAACAAVTTDRFGGRFEARAHYQRRPHAAEAMTEAAPVLRDDLQGKTSGAHGPRKHHNHIFTWAVGDAAGTARAISDAPVVATERIVYQRVHPCPLETCGCVASMDKVNGH